MSATGKLRGTSREDKQKKIGFDVGPAWLHVVWVVGRFIHYFTFISSHSYLFQTCPSTIHHPPAQQRGAHHAIIEQLFPLCSKARCLILLAGRQRDIRAGLKRKKPKTIELEIQALPSFTCVLLWWRICVGPLHREHLENYFAQLESNTYCLNAVLAHRSNLGKTGFLVQRDKNMPF